MSSPFGDTDDEADTALLRGGTSSSGEPTEKPSRGGVSMTVVKWIVVCIVLHCLCDTME